jgi:hypothetical protein
VGLAHALHGLWLTFRVFLSRFSYTKPTFNDALDEFKQRALSCPHEEDSVSSKPKHDPHEYTYAKSDKITLDKNCNLNDPSKVRDVMSPGCDSTEVGSEAGIVVSVGVGALPLETAGSQSPLGPSQGIRMTLAEMKQEWANFVAKVPTPPEISAHVATFFQHYETETQLDAQAVARLQAKNYTISPPPVIA